MNCKAGLGWAGWATIVLAVVLFVSSSVLFVISSMRFFKKVAGGSTAYYRWRSDVNRLWERPKELGTFPYPTIGALLMLPTASAEPMFGAVIWQSAKGACLVGIFFCCLRLLGQARPLREQGLIALLGLGVGARYIAADLTHGNINLFVAMLAVGAIYAFVRGRDIVGGMLLGLATAVKVTPGLLVVYFLYKRRWKLALAAGVGLVIFLVVVPVLAQGPAAAGGQFANWWGYYISPYVVRGEIFSKQINQSLPGVLYRLTVDAQAIDHSQARINLLDLTHAQARWLIRLVSMAIVVGLGYVMRGRIVIRDGLRQVAEYGLVLLAMLILSERSWKAHYVMMILPGTIVAASLWAEELGRRRRRLLAGLLGGAMIISWVTANDILGPTASDYAEAYGAVLVCNVLLVAALLMIHRVAAGVKQP